MAKCAKADSGKRREKGSAERKTWAADARKRANVAAREPRTKGTKEATKAERCRRTRNRRSSPKNAASKGRQGSYRESQRLTLLRVRCVKAWTAERAQGAHGSA